MAGILILKWGTVKGWEDLSEDAVAAMKKFAALGMSASAMAQEMTPEHMPFLFRFQFHRCCSFSHKLVSHGV